MIRFPHQIIFWITRPSVSLDSPFWSNEEIKAFSYFPNLFTTRNGWAVEYTHHSIFAKLGWFRHAKYASGCTFHEMFSCTTSNLNVMHESQRSEFKIAEIQITNWQVLSFLHDLVKWNYDVAWVANMCFIGRKWTEMNVLFAWRSAMQHFTCFGNELDSFA